MAGSRPKGRKWESWHFGPDHRLSRKGGPAHLGGKGEMCLVPPQESDILPEIVFVVPVSLRPRHPADLAAEQAERLKRRPSLTLRRGPNLALVAMPAILTALAVYVLLFYANRVAQRFTGATGAPSESRKAVVRAVDGVVPLPLVLEQPPPPSPESVVEEFERQRAEMLSRENRPPGPGVPVLVPELESAEVPPVNLPLPPLEAPALPAGTSP
jgi:hypothetical protein